MGYSPWGHKELDTTERLSTLKIKVSDGGEQFTYGDLRTVGCTEFPAPPPLLATQEVFLTSVAGTDPGHSGQQVKLLGLLCGLFPWCCHHGRSQCSGHPRGQLLDSPQMLMDPHGLGVSTE